MGRSQRNSRNDAVRADTAAGVDAAFDVDPAASDANTAASGVDTAVLKGEIIAAIQTCFDPEIPVNIYDLGLVYKLDVDRLGNVHIEMTLTSPACPVAELLPQEVYEKVMYTPGVKKCTLSIVWDPPWDPDKMSEAAKLELGIL